MSGIEDAPEDLSERDEEGAGIAEPPPVVPPRENPLLLGHEAAESVLLNAYRSARLPHAWLLSGPRGIGKATLAFRFARFLFAEGAAGPGLFAAPDASLAVAPDHPVCRRVASGGHADLLVVERGLDPKRKKLRSEIVVEDTRAIAGFLRLTPAEGAWRVVIVDGADMMNPNAANALLKILEEPPQKALLLLVSDNPGRLLPTIRSRCRILALKPLGEGEVTEALAHYRPDLAAGDRAILAQLAEGSIGRAIELAAAGGLGLYRSLVRLIDGLPSLDGATLHALADRLARADGEDSYRLLGELLPGWIARMVALATGGGEGEHAALPGEAQSMRRLAGRRGLDQWADVWENLNQLFALADEVNLDRKQVVLNAFFALAEAAR
ncbi:MAG TPA: DNA polymerase III subunit delta' [Stellaceae bacterium]|nr:DNA polymerase III subunit delta' [Stellaceae bacterium]